MKKKSQYELSVSIFIVLQDLHVLFERKISSVLHKERNER